MRRNCNKFIFFGILCHFLLWWIDANFWARPLKIAHGFFLDLFTVFWMRSWRNACHCLFGRRALGSWGTSNVVFEIVFCSNIAASKTSLLGAPSEDRPQETECMWHMLSRSSFESLFSGCVPGETHIDADNDWKTTRNSKGKTEEDRNTQSAIGYVQ